MIVYIESNFVFELGLGREQREDCATMLEWCRTGHIELRLPAYAVPETRAALRKREAERLIAVRTLNAQHEDAKRLSAADVHTYEVAEQALRAWTDREAVQIRSLIAELDRMVKFISLDRQVLEKGEIFRTFKVLTGDGDLLILASVMRDLQMRQAAGDTSPSLFATGDADFANAKTWLKPYSCDLLTSYSAAVGRLKAQLA